MNLGLRDCARQVKFCELSAVDRPRLFTSATQTFGFLGSPPLSEIIQKYSNFIASPILLNGKRINTVEALWRKNPKDVTEEQYVEFYKYIGNAYDTPSYKCRLFLFPPFFFVALDVWLAKVVPFGKWCTHSPGMIGCFGVSKGKFVELPPSLSGVCT